MGRSIDHCWKNPDSPSQREKRYEPRERARIQALERAILRERATKEAEERDRVEMRSRLAVWDDDESDELFYTDRCVVDRVGALSTYS